MRWLVSFCRHLRNNKSFLHLQIITVAWILFSLLASSVLSMPSDVQQENDLQEGSKISAESQTSGTFQQNVSRTRAKRQSSGTIKISLKQTICDSKRGAVASSTIGHPCLESNQLVTEIPLPSGEVLRPSIPFAHRCCYKTQAACLRAFAILGNPNTCEAVERMDTSLRDSRGNTVQVMVTYKCRCAA